MRSLTVFHLGMVGGAERSFTQVTRWLADRGELDVFVPSHGTTEAAYAELAEVSVLPYEALTYARGPREGLRTAARLVREVRMFRRELRRRRPDVMLVATTVLPSVLVAARLERVPAVVWAAELYDQPWKDAPLLRIWGWLLARATMALSAGVVSCSGTVARQFPARGGKPSLVAYCPIGDEYAGGDRDRGRARYGLEEADPLLAVVGNVTAARGQDTAIRALALLRRDRPDARLLILGAPHPRPVDQAYAAGLPGLAAELGVADAVTFAEPTGDMADVYAAADVVINPARFSEPFGRVAPEALMAGRPVVASRVGGIPEALRDGVDALLVPPDEPEAIAAAVGRLLDDPALAAELVASGRDRVRERFGWDQDLAAWTTAIESALAGAG